MTSRGWFCEHGVWRHEGMCATVWSEDGEQTWRWSFDDGCVSGEGSGMRTPQRAMNLCDARWRVRSEEYATGEHGGRHGPEPQDAFGYRAHAADAGQRPAGDDAGYVRVHARGQRSGYVKDGVYDDFGYFCR